MGEDDNRKRVEAYIEDLAHVQRHREELEEHNRRMRVVVEEDYKKRVDEHRARMAEFEDAARFRNDIRSQHEKVIDRYDRIVTAPKVLEGMNAEAKH